MMNVEYQAYDVNEALNSVTQRLSETNEVPELYSKIPDGETMVHKRIVHANATVLAVRLSFLNGQDSDVSMNDKFRSIFVSECIAICRDNERLKGITILDDSIVAVFNSPFKTDIQTVIDTAARINSIRLLVKAYDESYSFNTAICVHYGSVIVMNIADEQDKHIPDLIWNGKTITQAKKIVESDCCLNQVSITPIVYQNLEDGYKKFFDDENTYGDTIMLRTADVYNVKMKNLAIL